MLRVIEYGLMSQDIGIWQHMQLERVQPYDEMQVWDGVSGSKISFDWGAKPATTTTPRTIAYMNENLNLTSACLSRLDSLGGVDVFDKAPVASITYGPNSQQGDLSGWPVVSLAGGQKLGARLLIGADGANSQVRAFAGIQTRGWDYNRHGVVATLRLEEGSILSQSRTAYQRFLPSGPIALLPVSAIFCIDLF